MATAYRDPMINLRDKWKQSCLFREQKDSLQVHSRQLRHCVMGVHNIVCCGQPSHDDVFPWARLNNSCTPKVKSYVAIATFYPPQFPTSYKTNNSIVNIGEIIVIIRWPHTFSSTVSIYLSFCFNKFRPTSLFHHTFAWTKGLEIEAC